MGPGQRVLAAMGGLMMLPCIGIASLIVSARDAGPSDPPTSVAADSEGPTPTRSPDRRYETCAAARAAGLGPYRRGQDVEYTWYVDDDADGVACE
ncbi:MAG TPA: excalibur calcium-binding domain-containing protein [Pilimelia sp.]|nr:excalibur calcium-binding domain-containing protein [Pilimelia sp.]